jgi:hypothetical protein
MAARWHLIVLALSAVVGTEAAGGLSGRPPPCDDDDLAGPTHGQLELRLWFCDADATSARSGRLGPRAPPSPANLDLALSLATSASFQNPVQHDDVTLQGASAGAVNDSSAERCRCGAYDQRTYHRCVEDLYAMGDGPLRRCRSYRDLCSFLVCLSVYRAPRSYL